MGQDSSPVATQTLGGTLGALPISAAHTVTELVPGARILHYELIRELGQGGMGQVWSARDTKLGRRVAMKFVRSRHPIGVARFLDEARATAQCSHENIVVIHEVGEQSGLPFLVLEHLLGQTLRELLGPFGGSSALPAGRVVELALPIARALRCAHAAGIVHRDLKPENVFVTEAGQVKVLDFGIARAVELDDGAIAGTLPYMAPEQLRGDAVDVRADLWAFGVMLFEMLAGAHPVAPCTRSELLALGRGERAVARLDRRTVSSALCELVDKLLVVDRDHRLPDVDTAVTALEQLAVTTRRHLRSDHESPYPGLAAFQNSDADRFFGRDADIAHVVTRVRSTSMIAIVGPSGVGKSSFVRAGVGPALEGSGEHWRVRALRAGRQPVAALAELVASVAAPRELTASELHAQPGRAGELLRAWARDTGERLVIFVDQFEELYTQGSDLQNRGTFTAALCGIADDPSSPLRVIFAMRSDFLDRASEDRGFMDELARGLVFLHAPDARGLRDALVEPIALHGYRFESDAIVDELVRTLATTVGALPLLQFAAEKLWSTRDRQRRVITASAYESIGGLVGALAAHADRVIETMPAPAQRLARLVLRALVTPERTRAMVDVADLEQLADGRDVRRVIDQLVDARLLVIQTREGGSTVELVHEALIERWPALRRWLDEDQGDATFRAMLASAAKQWDASERPLGLLWTGEAADDARRFATRCGDLPARDCAFLDAVLTHDRRSKRARRVLRIVAITALAIVAAGATIAAVWVRGAQQKAAAQAQATSEALHAAEQREQERDAAEARRTYAERERARAETSQREAEQQSALATAGKEAADVTIEQQNEELRAKTKRLEEALATAGRATADARAATASAESAANELRLENQRKEAEIERLMKEALTRTLK